MPPSRPAAAPTARSLSTAPRRRRSAPVFGGLAVVLALWLGLAAPAQSPVAGDPLPAQPAAAVDQVADDGPGLTLAGLFPSLHDADDDDADVRPGDGASAAEGAGRGAQDGARAGRGRGR